jgi:hydroxymethylbilane synthase
VPEMLRLGTRGSPLALWQAEEVERRLRAGDAGLRIEREILKTPGDRAQDEALFRIGDKGLFTKDVERALADRRIDLAVHSLKDLPTALAPGLVVGAVLAREDPRDALVSAGPWLHELPRGARVGTSSLRRRAQLLALRPDLRIVEVRGNVATRLAKAERGECEAVVLALAGLLRLGLADRAVEVFAPERILPAVGQGALAVEVREDDARLRELVSKIDHRPTRLAVAAERSLLARLEGGCQVPVGALAAFTAEGALELSALVADIDGERVVRASGSARVATEADASALGDRVAERLVAEGAREVLDRIRAAGRAVPQSPAGTA